MKLMTRKRRRAFIESYEFPAALRAKLREKLDNEHQVAVALEGLREWYLACLGARDEMLGMPSKAVDVAWHEMILMTRTYHAFCERAFGRYLHHSPESVMAEPMRDGLARTLAAVEGSGVIAGVPLLFAIDGELGIEDGYAWDEQEIEQLRAIQPDHGHAAWFHPGHGGGCAGGGCGGGGCGGGGCGGGG
jgi:hypothetical protein